MRPLVSIIVPNYNHAPFLEERINSLLQQTYQPTELIFLDDASTDKSVKILQSHATALGCPLVVNSKNSGSPFAQWNRGVSLASGEFVWIAESDDSASPEFLDTVMQWHESASDFSLAYTASRQIDVTGQRLGPAIHDAFPDERRWQCAFENEGLAELKHYLYLQNTIPSASAVVFRKSAYLAAGGADTSLRLSGDWLQWARMLLHGRLAYEPSECSFTRIHQATARRTGASDGRLEWESLKVQREIRSLVSVEANLVKAAANRLAASWLQSVRAGRYKGTVWRHAQIFVELVRAHWPTALWALPAFARDGAIGIAKRFGLGRKQKSP